MLEPASSVVLCACPVDSDDRQKEQAMYDDETPVLIVGGSMVGLSAALFLARQGVRPLLVERHPEISTHPRAQAASPRTMELLDGIGLGDQVRAAETPHARYGDILQVE